MYLLAEALAAKKGPRVLQSGEKKIVAYYLTRDELAELFMENHYNLRRSTWRNCIQDWIWWNAYVPVEVKNPEKTRWSVLFGLLDKEQFGKLLKLAEDNDCTYYPKQPEGAVA